MSMQNQGIFMAKTILEVTPAFLATKEKLPDRLLFTGKISGENTREGYLFYLFEILSPWSKVSKIKKLIKDTLEKSTLNAQFSEDFFEQCISQVNESLNRLAEAGENEWVGNLNAIIGLAYDDQLLIAQSGKISGYLFRKGKISSLTESPASNQQNPLQTFSDIIAGEMIKDDRVVFGNGELYNQLSLDKIRRLTEKLSPKESVLELYRELRRFKITNINTIIIEAKDINDAENATITEIPEVIYLDQVKESLLKIAKKRLDPVIKAAFIHGKKLYGVTKTAAGKHGKVLFEKSKIYAGRVGQKAAEKYKTAREENKSKSQIGQIVSDDSFKKMKVKTTTYTNKNSDAANKFFNVVRLYLTNFWRFLSVRENRKYLYLVLAVIIIFGGYLKIRDNNVHQSEIKQEREIANSYEQAKDLFDKANENLALGKTEDSKELEFALALSQKAEASPSDKDRAVALTKEIHEAIDKLNKITRLYDQQPVFKLGDNIAKFVLSGYEVYGATAEGKVYYGNTQDKSVKLFASIGKENGAVKDAVLDENAGKIFFMMENNKLMSLDIASKTPGEIKLTDSSAWENTTAFDIFTSNIYLLDKDNNSVVKHIKEGEGYAKGTTYITAKKGSLANALDLAIDGNIYVLNGDGKMIKLTRGAVDTNFAISGIPGTEATSLKTVFTNANTNYIYAFDATSNKIIRFDKNGQFVKQYAIDGVAINDFSINDKIKKGYILGDGNVYQFDL